MLVGEVMTLMRSIAGELGTERHFKKAAVSAVQTDT